MAYLLCFGSLVAGWLVNECFFFTHNIYNWLDNACTLKTCGWIAMSMLNFENGVTFLGFSIVLSCLDAPQSIVKTTGIEKTYRTSFYVGVNNSSNNFAITNIWEKICRFFVSVGSIILWFFEVVYYFIIKQIFSCQECVQFTAKILVCQRFFYSFNAAVSRQLPISLKMRKLWSNICNTLHTKSPLNLKYFIKQSFEFWIFLKVFGY